MCCRNRRISCSKTRSLLDDATQKSDYEISKKEWLAAIAQNKSESNSDDEQPERGRVLEQELTDDEQ